MYLSPGGFLTMYLLPYESRYLAGRLSSSAFVSGSSTAELLSYQLSHAWVTILTSPTRCSARTNSLIASESARTLLSRSGCAASGSTRAFHADVGKSVSSQSTRIRLCVPMINLSSSPGCASAAGGAPPQEATAASLAARLAAAAAFISCALRLAASIFSA